MLVVETVVRIRREYAAGKPLVENEARPRRDRLRMTRIWDLLLREGYDGSYDAVRRYAARWLSEQRKGPGDEA